MRKLSEIIGGKTIRIRLLAANVGSPIGEFNRELVDHIFQRCLEQPDEMSFLPMCDLLQLSRLVNIYPGVFGIRKKVGHAILNEIKNRLHMVTYPEFHVHFIKIMRYLIVINVYDFDLLDNCFRPDYLDFMYKQKKQLNGALYEIDGCTRIHLKDSYRGNRLSDDYLGRFKYLGTYIPDQVNRFKNSEVFTYKIENVIRRLFTHYQYAHAISHHRHAGKFIRIK